MYYEVSGSRLRILGTNHVVPEGRMLPPFVVDAIQWADVGCIEHGLTELQPRTLLAEGVSLQDLLPADVWQALDAAWSAAPRQLGDLQRFRPWAAALSIGISRLRFSMGVEHQFSEHLAQQGSAPGTLESGDEVADLLDAVPVSEFAEVLRFALPQIDRAQANFEAMYERWAERDGDGLLAELAHSPIFGRPSVQKAFFLTRNRTWADRVMSVGAPATNTVLAVGCGHLVGPDNFLDLLRQRGLTIRAL
ncbi:TraB/GumN family protein [Variovorax saccharolyticus]|uniref:TraB/GumN family protein n=1 Tax=Variovorax saccharolyticus TaxID=3053516 RepID=UPI002577F9F7|nr:TraB/GumN family protein [Variovorax sp. J31P216]MDM0024629.1 TraB/GumN family protein [Variovorax sp. J31P216]